MELKHYHEITLETLSFVDSLENNSKIKFFPAKKGLTKNGEKLEMGFICYALKIFKLTGKWHELSNNQKKIYVQKLESFQKEKSNYPSNYFIDEALIKSYEETFTIENTKYFVKKILNKTSRFHFPEKSNILKEAINADNKQVISTLYELGKTNTDKIENLFNDDLEIINYLKSLDWKKPWSAGAQFSSLCVYTRTQNFKFENVLLNFISNMHNSETGSYHSSEISSKREVINGAMKVISGLDWLDQKIHSPDTLIDFCLENTPELEGCDIVDFIYVLYKSSLETSYRKKEINILFKDLLSKIMELYVPEDKGFSYFKNKSQTHYYGVKISHGYHTADIHGTILCVWAINMILNQLEYFDENIHIIKP